MKITKQRIIFNFLLIFFISSQASVREIDFDFTINKKLSLDKMINNIICTVKTHQIYSLSIAFMFFVLGRYSATSAKQINNVQTNDNSNNIENDVKDIKKLSRDDFYQDEDWYNLEQNITIREEHIKTFKDYQYNGEENKEAYYAEHVKFFYGNCDACKV